MRLLLLVCLATVIAVGALIGSPLLYAVEITINNVHFSPGNLQKKLILNNDGDNIVALKVRVTHRTYNEAGVENIDEPYKGMMVIPSQVVVGPGEEQVVNLRLTEPFPRESEVPLRLIVSTVPVSLAKQVPGENAQTGGVQMVYQLVRALYLTPANAQADVVIESLLAKDNGMQLVLVNKGNAHQVFYGLDVKLNTGYTFTISGQELGGGINMLPGDRRLINFKTPQNWPTTPWSSAKLISKD
ncbi:molecular chaperone [Thalassotalea maritima]|uniref:fimbrial biogenesis chaperone n=1 Tax=Thalassotalea maritima TaxID=3242416 RepID=UPI0035282250